MQHCADRRMMAAALSSCLHFRRGNTMPHLNMRIPCRLQPGFGRWGKGEVEPLLHAFVQFTQYWRVHQHTDLAWDRLNEFLLPPQCSD